MILINRELESLNYKRYECIPLRHSVVEKSITIDMAIWVKCVQTKKKYLNNIMKYKEYLWDSFFRTSRSIFIRENHKFNFLITTSTNKNFDI